MRRLSRSKLNVCALLVCASLGGCAEEEASVSIPSAATASDAGKSDGGGNTDGGGSKNDGGAKKDGGTGPTLDGGVTVPSGGRAHDARKFTFDEATLTMNFDALAGAPETDRFVGVLDGAGYRVEVPKDWNGVLVMYAHGYVGQVEALRLTTPSLRRYLIEHKYAWAASSYSANYYDVRAGIEDTNKLALQFTAIAKENGRELEEPTKRYLIGHSMGGHISGAAIEKEAQTTAINKVHYDGAVPMCGVLGDTELFEYFAAEQAAAHQLTGIPVPPAGTDYAPTLAELKTALFTTFPTATTPAGDKLKAIVMNLTGGARPMFELGFASPIQTTVFGTFGGDGTINGILNANVTNTSKIVFQLDSDPAQSSEEKKFNAEVTRSDGSPAANGLRKDGLRWIPVLNGEFDIPVVTLHTLGDMYVPFSMEQIYRRRAEAKGSDDHLVQRVVRGTGHCEFTTAEQVDAFEAMVKWETEGVKPEGDDVLDPEVVSAPDYGCKFTNQTYTADEMAASMASPPAGVVVARKAAPACPAK